MVMKQPFTTASPILANYDYTEVASGLGYVIFDGFSMATSAGTTYGLSSNPPQACYYESTGPVGDRITGVAGGTEYNFDTSVFSSARTIKGTSYISCFGLADSGNSIYFKAQFYRVDTAAAEHAIGSLIQSSTIGSGETGTYLVPVELDQTNFKKGDKLRLSITIYAVNTAQYITVDPAARVANSIPFKVYVPFKLEV